MESLGNTWLWIHKTQEPGLNGLDMWLIHRTQDQGLNGGRGQTRPPH